MTRDNQDQKGWGNHDVVVSGGNDGTKQVSQTAWNDSTDQSGLFGFVKQSGTISTNAIVPTGSVIEIQLDGTLNTLTPTDNNEFDLIYLIGKSGEDAITITHNHSGGSGNIRLLGGASITLSTTVPLILMARTIGANLEWLEYGISGTILTPAILTSSLTTVGALNSGSITSGFGNIDIGSSDFDTSGTVTCDVTGDVNGSSGSCTGLSATATALASGRTIAASGDVVWTSASFDGSGNVTGVAAIGTDVIVNADVKSDAAIAYSKLNLSSSIVTGDITDGTIALADIANAAKTEVLAIALGDESTVLAAASTTVPVVTYHMPYGFTLTDIKAGLTVAGTGAALVTVDVHEAGTTVLSTNVTVDAGEKTSGTALTQPVISEPALAVDSLIEIFVDLIDTDNVAAGLKVYLIGYQT